MLLQGFAVLLLFQLLGEALVLLTGILVPGPVLGMALLLAFLLWRRQVPETTRQVSEGLLRYLPLLFVPAGVGLINHGQLLQQDFFVIAITLVVSTAITLVVTLLSYQWLRRLLGTKDA